MRLLCDEMLAGLARWLRAAGHDAELARPNQADDEILARCEAEDRVLITRDRALAKRAGPRAQCLLLRGDDIELHTIALSEALGLDWTLAPFTRCLVDNTPLRPANACELDRIPDQSRALPGPFRACPRCGRTYWPGSHVRRMRQVLERWRDRASTGRSAPDT